MKKAIISQVVIFIAAYFALTPDQIADNTHLFGLIGSYDLVRGNSIWVMSIAAVLSAINIWVWWPRVKITTPSEKPAESAEVKEIKSEENDPVVPKMDWSFPQWHRKEVLYRREVVEYFIFC